MPSISVTICSKYYQVIINLYLVILTLLTMKLNNERKGKNAI